MNDPEGEVVLAAHFRANQLASRQKRPAEAGPFIVPVSSTPKGRAEQRIVVAETYWRVASLDAWSSNQQADA